MPGRSILVPRVFPFEIGRGEKGNAVAGRRGRGVVPTFPCKSPTYHQQTNQGRLQSPRQPVRATINKSHAREKSSFKPGQIKHCRRLREGNRKNLALQVGGWAEGRKPSPVKNKLLQKQS